MNRVEHFIKRDPEKVLRMCSRDTWDKGCVEYTDYISEGSNKAWPCASSSTTANSFGLKGSLPLDIGRVSTFEAKITTSVPLATPHQKLQVFQRGVSEWSHVSSQRSQ